MIEVVKILLVLLAIPVGILLARLARDELLAGRKWFLILCLLSFLGALVAVVFAKEFIGLALLFILICSAINYWASFNKRLAKKR